MTDPRRPAHDRDFSQPGPERDPASAGESGGSFGEEEQLLHLFHRAGSLLRRQSHHRGGGLDHGQGALLRILGERGDMPQRRMQDLFQVRAGSLSEILGKLEHKGFIARERDEEDRRASYIRLTSQGRAFMREETENHTAFARSLFAPLDGEERESLRRILGKMLESWLEEPVGRRQPGPEGERRQRGHGSRRPERGRRPFRRADDL